MKIEPLGPTIGQCLIALLLLASGASYGQDRSLVLVSESAAGGSTGNGSSEDISLSGDGRYVAFVSRASDLVSETKVNGDDRDVYLRDLVNGVTILVSKAHNASTTGNGDSNLVNASTAVKNVSDNGRFVIFQSSATDITADADANGETDVFVFDRVSGTNTLLSRATSGGTGNARSNNGQLSADGSVACFASDASDLTADVDSNNTTDIYFWDGNSVSLISKALGGGAANDISGTPRISADGNWVIFRSRATDLTSDADPNGNDDDLFLWSRADDSIRLISRVPGGGSTGNDNVSGGFDISADGRWIVFESRATDYTSDSYPNDPNDGDVFLFDRSNSSIILVSESTDGGEGGNEESGSPLISQDGNWIYFESLATDLTAMADSNNALDIFLYSREADTISLVSKTPGGSAGDASSSRGGISGDGRYVGFRSAASDLTTDVDTNNSTDLFLYDRVSDSIVFVSPSIDTGQAAPDNDCDDVRVAVSGLVFGGECEGSTITDEINANGSGSGGDDVYVYVDLEALQRENSGTALQIPTLPLAALVMLALVGSWIGRRQLRSRAVNSRGSASPRQ